MEDNNSTLRFPDKSLLSDWNDGFCPSGVNPPNAPCKIKVHTTLGPLQSHVSIYDDVLKDPALASAVYHTVVSSTTGDIIKKSWGVYVPFDTTPSKNNNDEDDGCLEQVLASKMVDEFLLNRCSDVLSPEFLSQAHGVAVWVLAAEANEPVRYHIDYAEWLRFRTNIIYPPLVGATLHLSANTQNITKSEGAFSVNKSGLSHYKSHGYKGALSTTEDDKGDWITVPYKYNRGILCDGSLPHYSSAVTTKGFKRVIVGFNIFDKNVGEVAAAYPEHSEKFNRYVKLSQASNTVNKKSGGGGITLDQVRKNPQLASFIKLLAKRVKEQDRVSQSSSC